MRGGNSIIREVLLGATPCPSTPPLLPFAHFALSHSWRALSSPDENGYFDGQKGYGYGSLEKFIGKFL